MQQYRWVSKEITENAIMPKCLWILTNTSPITKTLLYGKEPLISWYSKSVAAIFGEDRTKRALTIFNLKYNIDKKYYDCRCPIYKVCREFINRSYWYGFRQNINIECGQRRQNLDRSIANFGGIKENIIINKKLTDTSNELKEQLKNANQELVNKDIQKMNFWIRLPMNCNITQFVQQVKSFTMMTTFRRSWESSFAKHHIESDRLNRLIDKILDLENLKPENKRFICLKTTLQKNH
jgi:hypothetical protein